MSRKVIDRTLSFSLSLDCSGHRHRSILPNQRSSRGQSSNALSAALSALSQIQFRFESPTPIDQIPSTCSRQRRQSVSVKTLSSHVHALVSVRFVRVHSLGNNRCMASVSLSRTDNNRRPSMFTFITIRSSVQLKFRCVRLAWHRGSLRRSQRNREMSHRRGIFREVRLDLGPRLDCSTWTVSTGLVQVVL